MPVLVVTAAKMIGGVLVTMAGQLLTANFIKHLVVKGLEVIVKKTETEDDDKVLQEAKKAWGMPA